MKQGIDTTATLASANFRVTGRANRMSLSLRGCRTLFASKGHFVCLPSPCIAKLIGLILLFLPILSIGQTTFIINSYQVQAAGGGGSYDADAQTYFTALTTAGVTPTSQNMTDINTFVVNEKSNSIWSTRKAIYFPVWSNASANAINMKNPGTFNLTFFNSPTMSSDGISWNGTTQYATASGLRANAMGQNSISFSYYSQTNDITSASFEIGFTDNTYFGIVRSSSLPDININAFIGNITPALTNSTGLFTLSRTASNASRFYHSGATHGTNKTTASSAPNSTLNFFLAAFQDNFGITAQVSRKVSYADVGDGLSGAQETSHYTDVQALHTAFGIQK